MAAAMLREFFRPPPPDEDLAGPPEPRAWKIVRGLREDWDRALREAAGARRLADLHATRDEYRDLLQGYLGVLRSRQRLAESHHRAFGGDPARAADRAAQAEDVQRLYDALFPRWQTLDDLTGLAVEALTPSPERVAYLAAKYPPPASFWDEADDPFTAE